jgi:hypothetical protein
LFMRLVLDGLLRDAVSKQGTSLHDLTTRTPRNFNYLGRDEAQLRGYAVMQDDIRYGEPSFERSDGDAGGRKPPRRTATAPRRRSR